MITNFGIHNLSSLSFSYQQLYTLSHGLKFVPTPKPLATIDIYNQFIQFFRTLKLKYTFHNKPTNINYIPKFHISNNSFMPNSHPILDKYISYTSEYVNKYLSTYSPTYVHNLSYDARIFLNSVRSNTNIVIKPADKNLGLTIMDRIWYETEVLKHLSDTKTYKEIPLCKIPIMYIIESINDIIYSYKNHCMSNPNVQKYILSKKEDYIIPSIYILPKIHKDPISSRPIVSSHSWILTPASIWLDTQLQPLVQNIPTILKDSKSLVCSIDSLKVYDTQCTLITADVTSLYTVIPNKDGLNLLNSFLKRHMPDGRLRMACLRVAELILENNYIQFNNKYYLQIEGTAMGTPAAVCYANIFMYELEYLHIHNKYNNIILYKRLLDDILCIVSGDHTSLVSSLNNLHPNLKLNITISNIQCEFLDLVIYKGDRFYDTNILDLKVHQKTLNKYLYIPYNSYHTPFAKRGFIYTELCRYIRNSSSIRAYSYLRQLFYNRLRARGYPRKFLIKEFSKVSYNTRPQLLKPKPKNINNMNNTPIIFKSIYNPVSKHINIKHILQYYWYILQESKDLNNIYNFQNILISYKRPPNYYNMLVKAKYTSQVSSASENTHVVQS